MPAQNCCGDTPIELFRKRYVTVTIELERREQTRADGFHAAAMVPRSSEKWLFSKSTFGPSIIVWKENASSFRAIV